MSVPPLDPVGAGFREWMMRSRPARLLGTVIAVMDGAGMAGAMAVTAAVLIRGQPLAGASILVVPAIPVLLGGQLWMILWGLARKPALASRPPARGEARNAALNPRVFPFGPLSARLGNALLAVGFLAGLSAMTAFPSILSGGPAPPGPGCQYRLESHGFYTCVSRTAYEQAGAGEQRFAAGVMLGFFTGHLGVALGGRRDQEQPPAG